MAVITSGKTFANGEQLSADKLNQVITAATFNASDAVDGSTMQLVGGAMAVRDGGITKAKLATDALELAYPVGSIYMNASDSRDPSNAALLGFGTWVAFGAGKVPVGIDASDNDFDAVGSGQNTNGTTGAKTVTLTSAQSGVPAHAHKFRLTSDSTVDSGDTGAIVVSGGGSTVNGVTGNPSNTAGEQIGGNTAADAASAHTNLQPYIVVYMWKRTA
jgi:hypothetical protein